MAGIQTHLFCNRFPGDGSCEIFGHIRTDMLIGLKCFAAVRSNCWGFAAYKGKIVGTGYCVNGSAAAEASLYTGTDGILWEHDRCLDVPGGNEVSLDFDKNGVCTVLSVVKLHLNIRFISRLPPMEISSINNFLSPCRGSC